MKNNKSSLIWLIALVLFVAFTQAGCVEVLSQKLEEITVQTPNEAGELEPDYAIKYTVLVRSKGLDGKVRAMAKLYTPEGQFYKEQIVSMKSGEDKTLEFIFPEPTLPGTGLSEKGFRAEFSHESVQ